MRGREVLIDGNRLLASGPRHSTRQSTARLSGVVQKYIIEAREGELLQVIKQSLDEGMLDFTTALVQLVEQEFIHQDVALGATPKPEELKMRLKGIS